MHDRMLCPICGGYIEMDITHDRGECETCFATYIDGQIIPVEEEIRVEVDNGKDNIW